MSEREECKGKRRKMKRERGGEEGEGKARIEYNPDGRSPEFVLPSGTM